MGEITTSFTVIVSSLLFKLVWLCSTFSFSRDLPCYCMSQCSVCKRQITNFSERKRTRRFVPMPTAPADSEIQKPIPSCSGPKQPVPVQREQPTKTKVHSSNRGIPKRAGVCKDKNTPMDRARDQRFRNEKGTEMLEPWWWKDPACQALSQKCWPW